jgi:hypothetical protein
VNDQPLATDPNEAPAIGLELSPPAIDLEAAARHTNGASAPAHTSIIDEVLNLDEFLAADVRLAQKQAAWYTKPDLEARIEQLIAELDPLTDPNGRPLLVNRDDSLEESRTAEVVATELAAVQREYAASRRYILMQQLDQDDWDAFQAEWKDALANDPPYPPEFYAALISRCAIRPKIPADKVAPLRKKIGAPAFDVVWQTAWNVNTRSGVSIPKSLLSSVVLRAGQRG